MNSRQTIIEMKNVTKTFQTSYGNFTALKDISLGIDAGQLVALTGKSGSGKSTLLNMIAGIDRPSTGSISIAGMPINELAEGPLAVWRGKTIGVVFQFFQLLPTLTILENIQLPMDFCRTYPRKERKERARSILDTIGILDQADKLPSALSGGQQQRAAIARALVNDPPVIVADEPTGNLDSRTAETIFELFNGLSERGITVIVVTHEREFFKYFRHFVTLSDGAITDASGIRVGQ